MSTFHDHERYSRPYIRLGEADITRQLGDDALERQWAQEQALLGLAKDTPKAGFARGGLGALAGPPTVRIVVLPGNTSLVAVSAQDPKAVIPPRISVAGGQLPKLGTVRGVSSGYVAYPEPGRGIPWERFAAVHWHGGVDFYLGELGGQYGDQSRGVRRLIWLRRTVAWTWGAFGFQRRVIRRFEVGGPFRAIVGVADTSSAGLGDLGTGQRDPGGPGSPDAPVAVDRQILLHEDVDEWPDAKGIEAMAMRFGARLDLAFGGSGDRHLDHAGPDSGQFRLPQF